MHVLSTASICLAEPKGWTKMPFRGSTVLLKLGYHFFEVLNILPEDSKALKFHCCKLQ